MDELYQAAKDALAATDACGEFTQAIALRTVGGTIHTAVIADAVCGDRSDEAALIAALGEAVASLVCVWRADGFPVDLPSMAFRKMLCAHNAQNADAQIWMLTDRGYAPVRLGST